jgi:hypothetical protein
MSDRRSDERIEHLENIAADLAHGLATTAEILEKHTRALGMHQQALDWNVVDRLISAPPDAVSPALITSVGQVIERYAEVDGITFDLSGIPSEIMGQIRQSQHEHEHEHQAPAVESV